MFIALAVVLFCVGVFSLLVVRRAGVQGRSVWDLEQIRGFVYVGAGALTLVAVGVLVLGAGWPRKGIAEAAAVLGFMAYLVYLLAATVIIYGPAWLARARGSLRRR